MGWSIMPCLAYGTMCRWRRLGCIKPYPWTKSFEKEIWKIVNNAGMLWQFHEFIYIRFNNIYLISVQHYQLQILWPNMKSFLLLPMRRNSSCAYSLLAHSDCLLSSLCSWRSKWRAVSSPWSKCSLWAHRDNLFSPGICTLIQFNMHQLLPHWLWPFGPQSNLPQKQNKYNWWYKLKMQLIPYLITGLQPIHW